MLSIVLIIAVKNKHKFEKENFVLDENGFETDEKAIKPSYWYNYFTTDTRSKCFDCDKASGLEHGTQCFDCEKEGGRKVDKLLNRVLTR